MKGIRCSSCNKILKEAGAILFSPPQTDNRVKKYHLCKRCYNFILNGIKLGYPIKERRN